jgi:REP element-mobilizing transposase RayT
MLVEKETQMNQKAPQERHVKCENLNDILNQINMANTYSQIYIQLIFAVQGRQNFIKESFREELQKYIAGIIREKKQKLYAIYCMPDHTHIFVSIKPDIAISDLVRDIKANSSSFIKKKKFVSSLFSWQEGFGAFSYSKSQAKKVVEYILNQPKRHRKVTFRNEYFDFLNKFEVEYNEKYLFEFYD